MRRYSIKPRPRKYVKGYGFLSFARKYKKRFMDTGLDLLKPPSKKVVHETGEFLGNKIAYVAAKWNDGKIVIQGPVEEMATPLEEREEILT